MDIIYLSFLGRERLLTELCTLWPEDPIPEHLKNCSECGLEKHGTRMIWGEGNPQAPIYILLDNPGAREDRENKPFLCGTRQTLQKAANEVGLTADDLYVTFVLKRRPKKAYDKEETRKICINHFLEQIQLNKPKFIFCLGNVSVQSFFQNTELDVKSLRGEWHDMLGYQTTVAYHPLAVRRRPNLWPLFLDDWMFVAKRFR